MLGLNVSIGILDYRLRFPAASVLDVLASHPVLPQPRRPGLSARRVERDPLPVHHGSDLVPHPAPSVIGDFLPVPNEYVPLLLTELPTYNAYCEVRQRQLRTFPVLEQI